MDATQWNQLAARIDNWWGQPEFDDVRADAYFELLEGYDVDQVEAALRELLAEGHQFTPSLAMVMAKIEDDGDPALRFAAMWSAIRAALRNEHPERFLEPDHPLYLRFFREQGGFDVLTRVDESNTYAMHQLRKAWDELSADYRGEVRRGRVKAAIAAAPLVPLGTGAKQLPGPRKMNVKDKMLPPVEGEE